MSDIKLFRLAKDQATELQGIEWIRYRLFGDELLSTSMLRNALSAWPMSGVE